MSSVMLSWSTNKWAIYVKKELKVQWNKLFIMTDVWYFIIQPIDLIIWIHLDYFPLNTNIFTRI